MSYRIQIVRMEPTTIASVAAKTTLGQLSKVIREQFDKVYAFLKTSTVKQNGHNVIVYLDDEINVEFGVQIDAPFDRQGETFCAATPTGLAATAVHMGPHTALPKVHAAIRAWCDASGRKVAGPNWEVYGDWSGDQANLRTDVFYLLEDGQDEGTP